MQLFNWQRDKTSRYHEIVMNVGQNYKMSFKRWICKIWLLLALAVLRCQHDAAMLVGSQLVMGFDGPIFNLLWKVQALFLCLSVWHSLYLCLFISHSLFFSQSLSLTFSLSLSFPFPPPPPPPPLCLLSCSFRITIHIWNTCISFSKCFIPFVKAYKL